MLGMFFYGDVACGTPFRRDGKDWMLLHRLGVQRKSAEDPSDVVHWVIAVEYEVEWPTPAMVMPSPTEDECVAYFEAATDIDDAVRAACIEKIRGTFRGGTGAPVVPKKKEGA